MPSEQSAPLLDDIIRALGEKVGTEVTEDALREEFQRYLNYGVPAEQARNTILRHYGVQAPRSNPSGRRTLADLRPNEPFVNLLVRIVAINEKEVTAKGEKKRIQYGLLGDETMTMPFTAWKLVEAKKGDVVRVAGAYTTEYQGSPQVNFGDRCLLEAVDATLLPARGEQPAAAHKLAELRPGLSNVEITGRVLKIAPRTVTVQGAPKTVWGGTLGDDTGKVPFSSWHDFGLREGQVIRVRGGYVRGWRGTPQFSFDEKAAVETLPDSAAPPLSEILNAGPVSLADLYLSGGATDVTVEATLVEVRPGSGLVQRCTECKRVLTSGQCRLHGKVEAQVDLRIKGVLDDGTGAVNAIFGRDVTEALLAKSLDECVRIAKEAITPDVIEAELKTKLLARPLRVRGNVLVDEFGPTLLVQEAALLQRDLAAAAEALLSELEEAA